MIQPSHRTSILALGVVSVATFVAGCMTERAAQGTFDRSLKVSGPVQLEVTTGSGDVHITPGTGGEVRIHGEIHARGWSAENSEERLREIESNPPISQDNNLVRVGGVGRRANNVSIDYTIVVPPTTELRSIAGSGDVDVRGIQGPANFKAGSGNITASEIGNDVQALAGSGDVKISDVQGQVEVTTGSGDIQIGSAKGEVRVRAGSGNLEITQPNDNLVTETGSGNITVTGAHADVRSHTGSGEITIDGNPGASNYWDLRASSGNVTLRVPKDASFRLYARTSSGDIDAEIPIVMEGTAAKHELRARIGDGKARVEVETSSGKITLH